MNLFSVLVLIILIVIAVILYQLYTSNKEYTQEIVQYPIYNVQPYYDPYYYDYDSNSYGFWSPMRWRQWGSGWPYYDHDRKHWWKRDHYDYQQGGGGYSNKPYTRPQNYPIRNIRQQKSVGRPTARPIGPTRQPSGRMSGGGRSGGGGGHR
jgi:hypothetical protein